MAVFTVYTFKSLYKVSHLPFAVAAVPAILQQFMVTTVSSNSGTCVYRNDTIFSAANMDEHARRLKIVLERLKTANLRMSRAPCTFVVPEVSFLGYRVEAA